MTVIHTIADRAADGTSDAEAQALFEEARRRRRRVGAAFTILGVVSILVLGLIVALGSRSTVAPTNAATVGPGTGHHRVRIVTFPATFDPQQVVSESGKVWVVGTTQTDVTGTDTCAMAEMDPISLHMRVFPLPDCGLYLSSGDGQIFMADGVFTAATDSSAFHIESFSTVTHKTVVTAPVDVITTGTGYAHMALAYGQGSLWLNPSSTRVLEISPSTGAVVATVNDTLSPGGGHPLVVATGSGLWLAGGPGGPSAIERMAPGTTTPVVVYRGPPSGSTLSLTVVGDRVWAEVATTSQGGRSLVTRLVAFDGSGRRVVQTPPVPLGQSPLAGSDGQLWALLAAPDCTGPQRLWKVDGRTGTSVVIARWPSPVVPCPNAFDGEQDFTVDGHAVFVLASGSLFRLTV